MMELTPQNIFAACFIYQCLSYFFDAYLDGRQYKVHRDNVKRPKHLAAFITEEDYKKARLYQLDLHIFDFVHSLFNLGYGVLFLLHSGMPWLWDLSGRMADSVWGGGGEIWHSIVYVLINTAISTLLNLPFSYYRTFVIEQKHGFNRETRWFFFKDMCKSLAVDLAISIPLNSAVIYLVKGTLSMKYCFLYWWAFGFVVHLVMSTIYPILIAPFFDNYAPLPESDLKSKIEALASRVGFPLKKIYVVQNSQRSAHSNAYMYGFWNNKRIVLFDTLLSREFNKLMKPVWDAFKSAGTQDTSEEEAKEGEEKGLTDNEVLSVMGHELGHWKLWHGFIGFVMEEISSLVTLVILSYLLRDSRIFAAFGFYSSRPVLIGFALRDYVLAPLDDLVGFGAIALSRKFEFAADRFSAELGYAYESMTAEVKLSKDNLSMPIDDWLYAMFNHTHPSGPERVEALRKYL